MDYHQELEISGGRTLVFAGYTPKLDIAVDEIAGELINEGFFGDDGVKQGAYEKDRKEKECMNKHVLVVTKEISSPNVLYEPVKVKNKRPEKFKDVANSVLKYIDSIKTV